MPECFSPSLLSMERATTVGVRDCLSKQLAATFGASVQSEDRQWILRCNDERHSAIYLVLGEDEPGGVVLWMFDPEAKLGEQVMPLAVPDCETADKVVALLQQLVETGEM